MKKISKFFRWVVDDAERLFVVFCMIAFVLCSLLVYLDLYIY